MNEIKPTGLTPKIKFVVTCGHCGRYVLDCPKALENTSKKPARCAFCGDSVTSGVFYHFTPKEQSSCTNRRHNEEDVVNHPKHYTSGAYECFDEMLAVFGREAVVNFCKCNVYKYRYRSNLKNGEEDLKKADWYMGKIFELIGEN